MYTCASCAVRACRHGDKEKLPENRDFYVTSSAIEALGYGEWPRVLMHNPVGALYGSGQYGYCAKRLKMEQ